MSTETNKDTVRRFIDQVYVRLDANAVDELVADDFRDASWPTADDAKGQLRDATGRMRAALDDIEFVIDDLVAEGDLVAVRLTARARQVGEFMGIPASGRSYEIAEMHMFRLRDAQIVEHWHEFNPMALMQQLKGD